MKIVKNLKTYLIVLLVGILAGALALHFMTKPGEPKITSTTVLEQIQSSSELITTKYFYSKVGKFEKPLDMNGWDVPLTKKSFILTYDGEADLGVDLSKIEVEVKNKTIHIHLPEVKILNNTIDESSIEVYDETKNIFNPISINDYKNFAIEQKEIIEKEIETKNVYKKAEDNTISVIRNLLNKNETIHDDFTLKIEF